MRDGRIPGALLFSSLALGGCASMGPVERGELLFSCGQAGTVVTLRGDADGALVLDLGERTPASLRRWDEVREGYVIGQQGGHQSHLRLVARGAEFILFEGTNGELTDDPGRTYAGVTGMENGKDFRMQCERSGLNARLVESVRDWAARTGGPVPVPEDEGGPKDGWF